MNLVPLSFLFILNRAMCINCSAPRNLSLPPQAKPSQNQNNLTFLQIPLPWKSHLPNQEINLSNNIRVPFDN